MGGDQNALDAILGRFFRTTDRSCFMLVSLSRRPQPSSPFGGSPTRSRIFAVRNDYFVGLYFGLSRLFTEICFVSGIGAGEISCINPMLIVITSNHEFHIIRFIARGIGYGNIYNGW